MTAATVLFQAVEREVATYGEAESLDGVDLLPFVSLVPDLYQRVLHDVFGIVCIERYAEGEPVELVLEGQNVVAKADMIHLYLCYK